MIKDFENSLHSIGVEYHLKLLRTMVVASFGYPSDCSNHIKCNLGIKIQVQIICILAIQKVRTIKLHNLSLCSIAASEQLAGG